MIEFLVTALAFPTLWLILSWGLGVIAGMDAHPGKLGGGLILIGCAGLVALALCFAIYYQL